MNDFLLCDTSRNYGRNSSISDYWNLKALEIFLFKLISLLFNKVDVFSLRLRFLLWHVKFSYLNCYSRNLQKITNK